MVNQKVDSISAEVAEFRLKIAPIKALLGGTPAMREAGEAYLPKFRIEKNDEIGGDKDYRDRLKVAVLVPYFTDTVKSMTGRIFYKPVNVDKVHKNIVQYRDDFDGAGSSIDDVMESTFFEALAYGKSYVVIDYSSTQAAETVAEERASGARPYAFKVSADQVMDVRFNRENVTLLKYQHNVVDEENTNDFEVNYIPEIVLMLPGETRRYRKAKSTWELFDTAEIKVGGKTPQYVYAAELNLAKDPPLQNLAELNIKHWQSQSDQDNVLSAARQPILKITGLPDSDPKHVVLTNAMYLPLNADASYIEHTGKAIKSGQDSLDKLEEQMAIAGSKLLMKTKMAFTDQQAKDESLKEVSELMLYGGMLNKFIKRVLTMFGEWLKVDDIGEFDLTQNLANTVDSGTPTQEVLLAVAQGIISMKTAYGTLVSRNIIPDTTTFEEEQEQIDREKEFGLSRPPSGDM